MSYYKENKETILAYQKVYNARYADKIKAYQQEYFKKRLAAKNKSRVKPLLPAYKVASLERMLRQKYKMYCKLCTEVGPLKNSIVQSSVVQSSVVQSSVSKPQLINRRKELQQYQYSLPQAEPFSGFKRVADGFILEF